MPMDEWVPLVGAKYRLVTDEANTASSARTGRA
jgi:hypothetical protein